MVKKSIKEKVWEWAIKEKIDSPNFFTALKCYEQEVKKEIEKFEKQNKHKANLPDKRESRYIMSTWENWNELKQRLGI